MKQINFDLENAPLVYDLRNDKECDGLSHLTGDLPLCGETRERRESIDLLCEAQGGVPEEERGVRKEEK